MFNEVRHFDDLELEATDHPWGICQARFTTTADPEAVIAHYEAELRRTGWRIEPGPTAVDGWKGNIHYAVEVSGSGGGESTVQLYVGG